MDTSTELSEIIIEMIKAKIAFGHRLTDCGQERINYIMKVIEETFNDENSDNIHEQGLNNIFDSLKDNINNSIYDFFEIIVDGDSDPDYYNKVVFIYTTPSNNKIVLTPKSICMNILKKDYELIKLFFK
jgi:hypothetical protein